MNPDNDHLRWKSISFVTKGLYKLGCVRQRIGAPQLLLWLFVIALLATLIWWEQLLAASTGSSISTQSQAWMQLNTWLWNIGRLSNAPANGTLQARLAVNKARLHLKAERFDLSLNALSEGIGRSEEISREFVLDCLALRIELASRTPQFFRSNVQHWSNGVIRYYSGYNYSLYAMESDQQSAFNGLLSDRSRAFNFLIDIAFDPGSSSKTRAFAILSIANALGGHEKNSRELVSKLESVSGKDESVNFHPLDQFFYDLVQKNTGNDLIVASCIDSLVLGYSPFPSKKCVEPSCLSDHCHDRNQRILQILGGLSQSPNEVVALRAAHWLGMMLAATPWIGEDDDFWQALRNATHKTLLQLIAAWSGQGFIEPQSATIYHFSHPRIAHALRFPQVDLAPPYGLTPFEAMEPYEINHPDTLKILNLPEYNLSRRSRAEAERILLLLTTSPLLHSNYEKMKCLARAAYAFQSFDSEVDPDHSCDDLRHRTLLNTLPDLSHNPPGLDWKWLLAFSETLCQNPQYRGELFTVFCRAAAHSSELKKLLEDSPLRVVTNSMAQSEVREVVFQRWKALVNADQ